MKIQGRWIVSLVLSGLLANAASAQAAPSAGPPEAGSQYASPSGSSISSTSASPQLNPSSRHWLLAGVLAQSGETTLATDEDVLRASLRGPTAASVSPSAQPRRETASAQIGGSPSLLEQLVDRWTSRPSPARAPSGPADLANNPYLATAEPDAAAKPVNAEPPSPATPPARSLEAPALIAPAADQRSPFRPPETDAERYFPQLKRF